ncbi:threonine aldolase family protein [Sphingosinicella rhizophila]|uniref:Beta-eliminating lyase-related protein n=1 Tax=Sphingosinicella rhizophila TaxID=3050082 RepID=A0ABU3Q8W7_9SPHN|nr:beta-eliminating lyase-related protein [Sphingosinicella sp. GR2756]MDT9599757.1 beta-eliminating lyase-related protein [Sphingosinicella sp. GR2756]
MTIEISRSEFFALALGSAAAFQASKVNATPLVESIPPGRREQLAWLQRSCKTQFTAPPPPDDGSEMIAVGEYCRANRIVGDYYGQSAFLQAFERKIATLLGFEAGCFMPTGTMAQLIMLRIYADRSGNRTMGFHPSSHHLLSENDSFTVLHNLHGLQISPWERPISAADIEAAPQPLCAVSVEIPVRWIGGQLQTWEELEAIKRTCRTRGIKLHMDGARLWESQPYYGRSFADICRGFDTVYVSLYKMIGAPGGAMLLGPGELIREARTWRRRHGGEIHRLLPYVVSAAMRIDPILSEMKNYVKRGRALAAAIAADRRLKVLPEAPPTNLFRVFIPGDANKLTERRNRIAEESKIWVSGSFSPSRFPGWVQTELQPGPRFNIGEREAAAAFSSLLG